MSISREDVEHIARLARIELQEQELEKLTGDLSGVLDFVGKLNEVNTDAVLPLAGGIDLSNVMRADVPNAEFTEENEVPGEIAEIVKAAPDHKDGYIKVKSVF